MFAALAFVQSAAWLGTIADEVRLRACVLLSSRTNYKATLFSRCPSAMSFRDRHCMVAQRLHTCAVHCGRSTLDARRPSDV